MVKIGLSLKITSPAKARIQDPKLSSTLIKMLWEDLPGRIQIFSIIAGIQKYLLVLITQH